MTDKIAAMAHRCTTLKNEDIIQEIFIFSVYNRGRQIL